MRVGIVGAFTLLGRELAETMTETVLAGAKLVLLDEETVSGQITAIGEEVAVIQRIERDAFEGMDLCFFAGKPAETTRYWKMARDGGASIVDLTGALRAAPGVATVQPWVDGSGLVGEGTAGIVPAHGLAVMLSLIAVRCEHLGLLTLAATALIPASEHGQAGLEEMQRQAVSLLTFQPVPTAEYDIQVAFNLLLSLGREAKSPMEGLSKRVREDYGSARGGNLPELALQLVQAPVFHGYAVSCLLEVAKTVTVGQVEQALASGGHVQVVALEPGAAGTLNATGQSELLATVTGESGDRIWVWMTADNLRLAALQGIACGARMRGSASYDKIH